MQQRRESWAASSAPLLTLPLRIQLGKRHFRPPALLPPSLPPIFPLLRLPLLPCLLWLNKALCSLPAPVSLCCWPEVREGSCLQGLRRAEPHGPERVGSEVNTRQLPTIYPKIRHIILSWILTCPVHIHKVLSRIFSFSLPGLDARLWISSGAASKFCRTSQKVRQRFGLTCFQLQEEEDRGGETVQESDTEG